MINYQAQEEFLRDAYIYVNSNNEPNAQEYNPVARIYSQLVKMSDYPLKPLFSSWEKSFKQKQGISVMHDGSFPVCHFSSRTIDISSQELLKVFIPLGQTRIKENITDLFAYLARNKIDHASTVLQSVSNDDVVIRVRTLEEFFVIADFVNANFKGCFLPQNPFMINYGNVGVMLDIGYSYNQVLSRLIYIYVRKVKAMEEVCLIGFNEFIEEKIQKTEDPNQKMILGMISMITKPNYTINPAPINFPSLQLEENSLCRLIKDTYSEYGLDYTIMKLALCLCGSTSSFEKSKKKGNVSNYHLDLVTIKKIIGKTFNKSYSDVSLKDLVKYVNGEVQTYEEPQRIQAVR